MTIGSVAVNRVTPVALAAGVLLALNTDHVHAGPCSDEIARIESALRRPGSDVGPTDRQTMGAQLHRQPTPGSVERAEDRAASVLNAAIARARTFDADGNRAECLKAVEEIKQLTGMQ
jgi:hypothetical protein